MFDGASIFDQDLSSWDFCEMDFDNVFTGTPMRDEYYPVKCDSQSPSETPSSGPSIEPTGVPSGSPTLPPSSTLSLAPSETPSETPSAAPAKFASKEQLREKVEIYIQGPDVWAASDCDGTPCNIKFGYAKLLT
jgi:hypothetical protein